MGKGRGSGTLSKQDSQRHKGDKKEMPGGGTSCRSWSSPLRRALWWACALELAFRGERRTEAQGTQREDRQGSRAAVTRLHVFPKVSRTGSCPTAHGAQRRRWGGGERLRGDGKHYQAGAAFYALTQCELHTGSQITGQTKAGKALSGWEEPSVAPFYRVTSLLYEKVGVDHAF